MKTDEPTRAGTSGTVATPIVATEQVLSNTPLVVRRRVKWGECDPAGFVYTVTFGEYVFSAAELFYRALLGTMPQRFKHEEGFGTPTRALSFDFRRSLQPDEEFEMTVIVADIRSKTYVLEITGRTLQGEIVFVAHMTPVCVRRDERRSIDIPPAFRAALLGYKETCEMSPIATSRHEPAAAEVVRSVHARAPTKLPTGVPDVPTSSINSDPA